jgi:hypothetical protein
MSKRFFDFSSRQAPTAGAGVGAAADAPEPGPGPVDWSHRLQAAGGDDSALLGLVREASPIDVKLAAVAALFSEEALKLAERELREHDRRAHRLAKQRYTAAVAQREARARAAGLIEESRALSLEALIPLNRLVDIDRAWAALDAQLLEAEQRTEYAALMAQMADTTRERADQPAKLKRWTGQAREALASLQTACAAAASGTQDRQQLASAGAATQAVVDAAPPEAAGSTLQGELTRSIGLCPALDGRVAVLESEAADLAERWAQFEPLPDAALEALLQARFARWQQARQQVRDQRRAEQREQTQQRRQVLR